MASRLAGFLLFWAVCSHGKTVAMFHADVTLMTLSKQENGVLLPARLLIVVVHTVLKRVDYLLKDPISCPSTS